MLLSKAYIRKQFIKLGIQMSDEALELVCEQLKADIKKYALNAKDLGYKRLVIEEVLNFVRNETKNAIKEFQQNNIGKKDESFFSKGQGEKTTELFKR